MNAADYREAASLLRAQRVSILAEHALRVPFHFWPERFDVYYHVYQVLHWHEYLGVPFSTTYEVLRQNRATILQLGEDASLPIMRFNITTAPKEL